MHTAAQRLNDMMSSHIKTKGGIPTHKHTLKAFTVTYYVIIFPECDDAYYNY